MASRSCSVRDRVAALLERDFPGLEFGLGSALENLEDGSVRAVAAPAAFLEGILPAGLDGFVFPPSVWSGGDGRQTALGGRSDARTTRFPDTTYEAALVFPAGDALCRALRRFYLPPVIFVGAGPGGLGSMTVDGARALRRADVVLADALCGTDVLRSMAPDAVSVSVGKHGDSPSTSQQDINRRLIDDVCRGRRVVRLKGGDPGVFGRLDEEIGALREQGLSYRVLGGVSAASAAAAFVGQPLTVREAASEVILSTGRLEGGKLNPFPLRCAHPPTLALYMSRRVLAGRMQELIEAGYPPQTPAVVVEKLGSSEARWLTGTVADVAARADEKRIGTPMVLLVGSRFHEPDHLPLLGVRIWLVAELETAITQREPLEELGATCVMKPLIEPRSLRVDPEVLGSRPFDWMVITSKKAVDYLFDLLERSRKDVRWLPRVAAIGDPAIRKLEDRGVRVDLVPGEPTRLALARALVEAGVKGSRVLLPFSAMAPDYVGEVLREHGAEVVRADLYTLNWTNTGPVPECDVVLFSSESTVRSAIDGGLIDQIRRREMVVGGIGRATCELLAAADLPPRIAPQGTSPDSLGFATRRYFAQRELAAFAQRELAAFAQRELAAFARRERG